LVVLFSALSEKAEKLGTNTDLCVTLLVLAGLRMGWKAHWKEFYVKENRSTIPQTIARQDVDYLEITN
jgi:hypothetical protein